MIYTEKEDKNILVVLTTGKPVNITVDCQYGTLVSVSFYHKGLKTARCGEGEIIGVAQDLKGKTIEFNGSAGNPANGQLRIIHTIRETDGNELIYTFPDDYTGNPAYTGDKLQISYAFYVKFV